MEAIFAYAQLNARVQPLDRGDRYEDPLQDALATNGWAEVTGGGTSQELNGHSAQDMRESIAAFMAEYPLCQKARLQVIA